MITSPTTRRYSTTPSDAELVSLALEGDAVSFGVLLERHRAGLYGRALGTLGYGRGAEDAVHDTFLVALRKLDTLREPAAVGGWLHRILHNVCLTRLRAGHGEIPIDEVNAGCESPVEEAVERMSLGEWVWDAISCLPENLRVTVMLRYFGSCASYGEIAAILGVPVGTVRSRLNQAKVKLAESLLECAGREEDGARRITASRARFFDAAYGEYSRGERCGMLMGAFSEDLVINCSDGTTIHDGYEFMGMDLTHDMEVGIKMRPTNVVASRGVAVIECDIENPPEDPNHCPPAIAQVAFYRGDRIERIRWHLAPRPLEEGCWETEILARANTEGE